MIATDKWTTAEQALKEVRSGHRVYVGSNCGQPTVLTDALAERHGHVKKVEVIHLLTMGPAPYLRYPESFWHKALFVAPNSRGSFARGDCDYIPLFLSEIPSAFRTGVVPIDVALIAVSTPDRKGYCSMGISVDVGKAACEVAKVVIAEVNSNMPRTGSESLIHIDEIDWLVPSDRPLLEYVSPDPDEIARNIAGHVSTLVPDGATIQTGIGRLPSAILDALKDKNDLGVHTEMFSDALITAINRGNVTCRRKSLHRGKVISTFTIGTKTLYEHIDGDPFFEFRTSEYVNDPFVIAQNDNLVAINGAIEVDLTGQVASDSIGTRIYSGIGGQVDFIRGAARSKGGRPIITLPSMTKSGESRIVPTLKPGAGVVTSRGDVHFVVTEHGTADLHGKTLGERCEALIEIADPSVRDSLRLQAQGLGLDRRPRWEG